ncbi:MAG: hypothetical protein ACREBD_12470 [Blastocatellia bacterium]
MAAHEGVTMLDASSVFYPSPPLAPDTHLVLALSKSKHATYTFNPDFRPLLPYWVLASTIATLDILLATGQISYITYLILVGLAYDTYYACVVERFSLPQYGYIADPRINVGEVNNPINSCGFIQDNSHGLRGKLEAGVPW